MGLKNQLSDSTFQCILFNQVLNLFNFELFQYQFYKFNDQTGKLQNWNGKNPIS
jgi:hypothetical protein